MVIDRTHVVINDAINFTLIEVAIAVLIILRYDTLSGGRPVGILELPGRHNYVLFTIMLWWGGGGMWGMVGEW